MKAVLDVLFCALLCSSCERLVSKNSILILCPLEIYDSIIFQETYVVF